MYTSQAPQSIISYHCIPLTTYHLRCYITVIISNAELVFWVLNTYLKGYIYIYLWKKKKKNRRAWQKTLTVFSLAFWRGRRVNRDLFRVIRLFTGELHSEKGVLENDRTGFYCRSHTGQRTNPVRDHVFWWWSSGKRTQLAEIRFGLIPEVCVSFFLTDSSSISAAAGDEGSKNYKKSEKE